MISVTFTKIEKICYVVDEAVAGASMDNCVGWVAIAVVIAG
jgi:hypothetical protein